MKRCQGRVRKLHPRMFYPCLTNEALIREKNRLPSKWCFRTQPNVLSLGHLHIIVLVSVRCTRAQAPPIPRPSSTFGEHRVPSMARRRRRGCWAGAPLGAEGRRRCAKRDLNLLMDDSLRRAADRHCTKSRWSPSPPSPCFPHEISFTFCSDSTSVDPFWD